MFVVILYMLVVVYTRKMEWSQEKTIQFIECYRSYPLLWDSKDEFYKNKIKRHDALVEIAAKFEVEKVEVERKIKNLQSHFLREKKKEQDSKKSGSGADESFTSKWFAYKSLLFLSSRNKPRKTMDSQMIDYTAEDSLDSTTACTETSDECRKRSRNVGNVNEKISSAYSIMTEVYKNRSDKDEFSLFGDQVAVKLRKIYCPYARLTLQNKINTLLMEGELGVYDSYNYYRPDTSTSSATNDGTNNFVPDSDKQGYISINNNKPALIDNSQETQLSVPKVIAEEQSRDPLA
ncbi:uncharacterized protein LOC132903440 [Amyelois transitella]|uniref:uncharacterized protein LOC106134190 n=1 Tax=Amyelois transitella TaxID=680683 RepID=UPI00067E4F49|nr:uncharacterized protein LOC106134190 [Amyelois transitella]XP_013191404.1 uncharacterized protein LOC106135599 [Amyelois transitella]XP_013197307.1 uncharacterized protein LOC106140277 [Amyelois transitella]XP_013199867.1 uncharacterized protein LOC106142597 [Amyelois transitella]XP_060802113.1 uncharacterized protein LOC106132396 [Amyelois transitella]XP_060802121.1 uncharacterized protein LOC132902143 [Amyelois transitella]XP_060802758.1 uncharacterized protein LOC132902298 [Amyelois tra